jgi:hypothetical protein
MRFSWILKGVVLLALAGAVFGTAGWFGFQLFIKPHQIPPEELVGGKLAPPPDLSIPEFEKAMKVKESRQPLAAREALEKFTENFPFSSKLGEARKALGEVNADIFFSTIEAPEKIRYEVRPGDALNKIERKFKTSGEVLMRCNNLDDPRRLRVGQVLMISQPDFALVIERKTHAVTLLNKGKFFKSYAASTWTAPIPKKGMEKVEIAAKVKGKTAWANGAPVNFGSKDYAGSVRWVELTARNFTLYSDSASGPKPPGGIGLPPEEMEELSTLLGRGVPVTIR